nr:hypothetical protein GCM10020093_013060 [Planobispora longispora]
MRLAHAGVVQFDPAAAARLTAALTRPGRVNPAGPTGSASSADPVNPAGLTGSVSSAGPGGSEGPAVPGPPGDRADLGLTGREIEVLRLVARGSTNREIAERLYLSEGTVKNHISRILGRLGLRDRTQAAIYARDRGLL